MRDSKKYTLGEVAFMGAIAPVLIALMGVLSAPFVIWKSYVITILWSWFVVPYFNLPPLSIWLVYGLMTLYGIFKSDYTVKKEQDDTNWKSTFVMLLLGPAMSLGVGYLIHHFALHAR